MLSRVVCSVAAHMGRRIAIETGMDRAISSPRYVLKFSCRDRPGIVAAVSTCLFRHSGNIDDAQQFDDAETGLFFMRVSFTLTDAAATIDPFREAFAELAAGYGMDWTLQDTSVKQRVLLLVSKFDHCLSDILYRWQIGELPMEIVGVVANYPRETYSRLNFGDVPFIHLPVSRETKAAQESRLWRIIEDNNVDLIVLARYMQILSDDLSTKLSGRCINIHHSFLPGFKGAKPYHQAFERGVKLIGATAHYVTAALDEGPIIEQDVERVTHYDRPDDLVRKGRDVERRVLARALAWHLQGRIIPNGGKTVVFRD